MRRYVLAVVVEAEDADAAYNRLDDLTLDAGARDVVYVGDACPIGPAAEYDTDLIALVADGELAVAAPPHAVERRRAEFQREIDRLEGEGRR